MIQYFLHQRDLNELGLNETINVRDFPDNESKKESHFVFVDSVIFIENSDIRTTPSVTSAAPKKFIFGCQKKDMSIIIILVQP
uniref:Uncharacterized protein n=1 Tax=Parastrongyloides trichosuri TaxID=131310 RepID=A0A0N4Z6P5_PARTI